MKWLTRISLIIACVFCENAGHAQILTVSVAAFSSSTGATIVATAPPGASVALEQASSMGGFSAWSVLASHDFGTSSTWQFQDSGATGVPQRYYRLRSNAFWVIGGPVYSVNIAGLARLNAASGVTLLANPLLAANNTLAEAFRNPENGFSLFRLNPTGYEVNNYLFGWTTPSMSFAPGEGFFLRNPSASPATLAFFGEVPVGSQTTAIPPGQSLLSSKIPQAGPLQGTLGFPALDFDVVYLWSGASFGLYFYDESFGWTPSDPNLSVGQAFWLQTSVLRNWTRIFSPNVAPSLADPPTNTGSGSPPPAFVPSGGSPVQVNFFTYNPATDFGRAFESDGTTPLGNAFVGQLYAGSASSEESLAAVGSAAAFGSGPAAGYLNSGLVSVPGISAAQNIYLQLRVWEGARGATYAAAAANGSKTGKSAIFSVTAVAPPDSGPTVPPPNANGFASFSIRGPGAWMALESFDYPAGGIVGRDSGIGFTSGFTGAGSVGAGSLSYTDATGAAFPSTGERFTTAGSHSGAFRELATNGQPASVLDASGKFGRDGAVIYVAFLTSIATGDNTGYGGLSLYDGAAERLFLGDPGFAFLRWGYDPQGGTNSVRESSVTANATPRLLVGRIDFASGSETIRLYVDPSLQAEPTTASAGPSVVSDFRFTRLRMQSGPQPLGPGGTHHFDEIRIGTNYADVVAPLRLILGRQPAGTNIIEGQSANFKVAAAGPGPLRYQWFHNATNAVSGATNASLTLTAVQLSSAGGYHVVVTNGFGVVTSLVATLTVNPAGDSDGDGMPDSWEQIYGLNPNSAVDALTDLDGDGVTNRDEYLADTSPVNAQSLFRVNSLALSGGLAQLQIATRAGLTYGVDYMDSLDSLFWTPLAAPLIASGPSLTVVDSAAGLPRRFYRAWVTRSDLTTYSVNMVGFANITAMPGSNNLVVPFLTFPSTVETLIPNPPEGSCVVKSGGQFACYEFGFWEPSGVSLAHGEPFEFHNPLSTDVTLTFAGELGKPVIISQPSHVPATIGGFAAFQVTSIGAPPLHHQWYFNRTNLIADATSSALPLANLQLADAGAYSVVVNNSFGSVTSFVASLSFPPVCTTVPSGLVGWWSGEGNALDFVGANNGLATNGTTYAPAQVGSGFSLDGVNDYVDIGPLAGLDLATEITVMCWVKKASSGTAAGFVGKYDDAPNTSHENSFLLANGQGPYLDRGIFSVVFDDDTDAGLPGASLIPVGQWMFIVGTWRSSDGQISLYKNGVLDATNNEGLGKRLNPHRLYTAKIGEWGVVRGSNYKFHGLIDEVAIFNRALGATEIAAIYAAGSAGMCPPQVQVRVGGVLAGSNPVVVTNSTMVSFQTSFSGGAVFYALNGSHPGAGTLYTGPLLVNTSAVVRAIAYNADYTESAESAPVTLTVARSPFFTQQPATQTVLASQPVTFTAAADGAAPISYQWFFNGTPIGEATNTSFTRGGTFVSHAGSYWVVTSNPHGSATSVVAGLTVLLRPSIASQPASTNVNTGENATFCVSAIGSAPLVFQWRKNGVNIPGATNSCYAITNVQATNAGAYSVVVGNGADAVTSAEAELVLADLPNGPPAEDFFANRNGLFGNSGALEVNNIGATKEAGEPEHAGKPGGSSVWYAWTPENSGIATLRTSGSAFDTLLAVYRGDDAASLTPVVANEDGGGFLTSEVRFNATNNVEYQIAIDGFAAAQGTFVLSWDLEATVDVLPVITGQPQSLTVPAGADAPFSVIAGGNGLIYQWYFNGARISGATNSSLTRTNVQSGDVGYYAAAVTNSQFRGLLSEAAVLEIGPFPDVRSTDKVEDLIIGLQPAPLGGRARFQPASSGFASVAIGSLGTQVLNTTNSTTSFRETNHCGVIGGSSRWFKLKPAANGLMSIDTFGSTFDTVLAAYTGDPLLGGYPTKLIDCNNNAATDARWSRVLYSATNAIEYLIAVDGAGSAAGTVQLNWSLGLPPVIVSNPPPLTSLVGEGEALQLTTALTNGLPPPKLQWYRNGELIADATNATYAVGAAQRMNGGVYTVVAYNSLGSLTSIVANVTVEVPLELNLQPVLENGRVHFRVSGTASQTFILQGSTNFVNWQPLYTNTAAGAPVNYDDRTTTNRSRRYYRALPWP